jgi:hypothetical protein
MAEIDDLKLAQKLRESVWVTDEIDNLKLAQKLRETVWDKYTKSVYWMEKTDRFYLRLPSLTWAGYSILNLRTILDHKGFFGWISEPDPKLRKIIEDRFWKEFRAHVMTENIIKGAGLVGGRCEGVLQFGTEKFLVTGSPHIIEPADGDCPFILNFLTQLLPNGQSDYFLAWLRQAYFHLRNQTRSYGQALFLVGPRQCGKSLLQVRLITPILGGRSAEPFTVITGETRFNSDLVRADHLMIEDKGPSWRGFDRNKFADNIKAITVNVSERCEGKGQDAFTVYPIRRLTISINEESQNFQLIPALDDSILDKLMIFRCETVDFGCPVIEIESRMEKEIPFFLNHLIKWDAPEHVLSPDRFGVKPYMDPAYRQRVEEHSYDETVRQMLDVYLHEGDQEFIEGNASQIWGMLSASSSASKMLMQVTRSPNSLGRQLVILCKKYPESYTKYPRIAGGTVYKISREKEKVLI